MIRQTDRYTLPNMEALEDTLHKTVDEQELDCAPFLEIAQKLYNEAGPEQKLQYSEILHGVESLGEMASRKAIRAKAQLKTKAGNVFNQKCIEQLGVWLGNDIRQNKSKEHYFWGMLDIRWYREGDSLYYFSGYPRESLNKGFPHACCVRKVTASKGASDFEQYLPLLAVDFIRASGWPVTLFPFKYLNEWCALKS